MRRYQDFTGVFTLLVGMFLFWNGVLIAQDTSTQIPQDSVVSKVQTKLLVEKIEFYGNNVFTDLVLIEQLEHKPRSFLQWISGQSESTMYRDSLLNTEKQHLLRYYQERGYFQAKVEVEVEPGTRPDRIRLVFVIEEGSPVRARNLEFSILAPDSIAVELRSSFLNSQFWTSNNYIPGNILEPIRRERMVQQLSTGLRERGFAYSTIQVETVMDSTALLADVKLTITPGEKVYLNLISIEGTETVSDSYVRRISDLNEGDLFNISRLEKARANIRQHPLFRDAVIELSGQPTPQSIDLLIRVRELPLRSVQVMAGIGTEDLLRARASWTHRNVNRKAHQFSTLARVSFIEQEISGNYQIPYLINNQSSYSVTPFIQHLLGARRSYELFSAGFRQTILYQLTPFFAGTFSHQISYNEELSGRKTERLPREVLNYNVSSFGVSMAFTRGYRFQKGWAISGAAEVSSPLGLATFSYQKLSANVLRYQPISRRVDVVGRIQLGSIFYNGSSDLPANVVFYAGGTNSVRGWSREFLGPKRPFLELQEDGTEKFRGYLPTGGRALFTSSLEARYSLDHRWKGVGIATFLDAGQIWRSFSQMDERAVQFGTGFGVRYDSVVGPIRLDLAMKLNPNPDDLNQYEGVDSGSWFRRIGIHLNIGSPF